jgi:hypothetical protein
VGSTALSARMDNSEAEPVSPRGQVIEESLGQLPKKLAAGPRVLAGLNHHAPNRGRNRVDHKLGQLRYIPSRYSFVAIALFSMKIHRAALDKRVVMQSQLELR